MLFSVAFLFQFLVAGLTGIMLAVVPFDWQMTDYATSWWPTSTTSSIGGFVFLIFAGIYYWFPKVTGRMLDERLGRWHFWLFLVGFNMTMGILHFAGLLGMPRRIYTYQTGHGWDTINLIASLGVVPQILGVLIFVINIIVSAAAGRAGRRRSLGRVDARVDDHLAPAGVQLRDDPRGAQPPAALGPQAPRRPGLEVRVSGARRRPRLAAALARPGRA